MRNLRKVLVAGAAAAALVGASGLAVAQTMHTMTVHTPDGGLARIVYSGNIPPRIAFAHEPFMADFYQPYQPFAALDRISVQMDRQMDALMRETNAMMAPLANPDRLLQADMRDAPPGATSYSYVSTMAGPRDFCTRSMQVTRAPNGGPPKVVTHTSGNCSGSDHVSFGAPPFAAPSAAPRHAPTSTIEVKASPHDWRAGPQLREVAWRSGY